jgi:hypothetical protein
MHLRTQPPFMVDLSIGAQIGSPPYSKNLEGTRPAQG